ncbi:cytochrome c-type biogenesis protein CcmH [Rubrivivax rivuli]|uniref:Cytochrome c-type biogenesis protein n=2 Tax=Rubrivivax rivuli TaxID=1862385 RepID=A0A437RFX6_9BURK|nr:cytochrome c-type biogenesis protein CcmH [Rubrivivax rivuli]
MQAALGAATLVAACLGPAATALAQPSAGPAPGKLAQEASADPALEKRVLAIAAELRCLVCQNETIAASHADLAVDLRNQVREMLRQGRSEREILDYMTARYGDFVLYRPPVKPTTALLWFGPAVLLVGGLMGLWLVLRHRARLAPEAFEADEDDPDAAPKARS